MRCGMTAISAGLPSVWDRIGAILLEGSPASPQSRKSTDSSDKQFDRIRKSDATRREGTDNPRENLLGVSLLP
jgi:hypothetical protein